MSLESHFTVIFLFFLNLDCLLSFLLVMSFTFATSSFADIFWYQFTVTLIYLFIFFKSTLCSVSWLAADCCQSISVQLAKYT